MNLTTEEITLILAALKRAITRFEAEERYAKSGRGANNAKNVSARAKKLRNVRDRMLKASSVTLAEE
jgi:hypothetical protein